MIPDAIKIKAQKAWDWAKKRAAENNSKRAIAVLIAVLSITHIIDPLTIGLAADGITQTGLLLLAFDAFVTPQDRS